MKTKIKKTVTKHIHMTPAQWKTIDANAAAAGVDLKTYVKNQLLNGRPCPGRESSGRGTAPTVNIAQMIKDAGKSQSN